MHSTTSKKRRLDDLEHTVFLVNYVYQQVLKEFIAWNHAFCTEKMNHLDRWSVIGARKTLICRACADDPAGSNYMLTSLQGANTEKNLGIEILNDSTLSSAHQDEKSIYEVDYGTGEYIVIPVHNTSVKSIPAHAPYEAVTPGNLCDLVGDDPSAMPFLPLSDDPSFNVTAHIEHYGTFEWQGPMSEPDLEAVILKSADRLLSHYNVSIQDLEETDIFPLPLLSGMGRVGLLEKWSQRNPIPWLEHASILAPSSFVINSLLPEVNDLTTRLKSMADAFCPKFSCLQPLCHPHLPDSCDSPMPIIPIPTDDELRSIIETPCSEQCFKNITKALESGIVWNKTDANTIKTFLEVAPDTTPCDLAVICRKPCFEVFHQRNSWLHFLFPTTKNYLHNHPESIEGDQLTIIHPCKHSGPCEENSFCTCFVKERSCQRGCSCGKTCSKQWPGCQCALLRRGKICKSNQCPCFRTGRECTPGLCLNCNSKADICKNSQISWSIGQPLEVKNGISGLGAFLTKAVNSGDLIIEYIGQLIFEDTVTSRGDIAVHLGRNYNFDLNEELSIDATTYGNESRFINHSSQQSNSQALIKLVNNEQRIGIYATKKMPAGTEVLFDYGPYFFKDGSGS